MLEAENKRLQAVAHSNSGLQDTNIRRQMLEMRKKQHFAEMEKKQLTEKVTALQNSLKTVRESRDWNSSELSRGLQEENASLHDRVRGLEESFTRKQAMADLTIAEAMKENDRLRHKLTTIQQSLTTVEQLTVSLDQLSSCLQSQGDTVWLHSAMATPGGDLTPLEGTLGHMLQTMEDLQLLLSAQCSHDVGGQAATLPHSATPTDHSLPPVLKQLPPGILSNFQGSHTRVSRSLSTSSSPNVLLQLKEKIPQLHSDSLSISGIIKERKERASQRDEEVLQLRERMASLQLELKTATTQMCNAQSILSHLQQTDLSPEQLSSISLLEKQVEKWQDKVIARDEALKDIDARMREDYESHDQTFSQLKSQLLALREELSYKRDALLAKDQFIHEVNERCLSAENEVFTLRKEMEHVMQEALNIPEGFQLSGHSGNITELIRSQTEELHELKSMFNEYSFEITQLRGKLETAHRENAVLQQQAMEMERHHLHIRDELHTERDYLRQINLQLIEQQMKGEWEGLNMVAVATTIDRKMILVCVCVCVCVVLVSAEDSSDLAAMVKDCQESLRKQRDTHKLASEVSVGQFPEGQGVPGETSVS